MSDPRNAAHAKKVTQEKKHHLNDATPPAALATQPDDASPAARPSATLEGSLVVLSKLKELEFHSRAHLERLAELTMTIEDDLKQKEMVGCVGEVYSAQSLLQTKLTALIEVYQGECDRMHAESV
jgi:hypothetical protein